MPHGLLLHDQALLQLILGQWPSQVLEEYLRQSLGAGGGLGDGVAGDLHVLALASGVAGGGVSCLVFYTWNMDDFKVKSEGFFFQSLESGIFHFIQVLVAKNPQQGHVIYSKH